MSKIATIIIAGALVALASAETPQQQADAFFKEGVAAEKAYDPVTAEAKYASALKAYPSHANARYSLGQIKINAASIAAKGREVKFGAVMVPLYQLDGATLQEALDSLSLIVEKESKKEITPNFVIDDPKGVLATAKLSLNLKNMPAKGVLKYLTDQTNAKARYDEHAIVITPLPK